MGASWDIVEDTIARTVERSDAYRFADMVKCCFPKCVGFTWLLLSLCTLAAAIYFSLLMRKPYENNSDYDYWNNVMYGVSGGYVLFAILERIFSVYCLKGKG